MTHTSGPWTITPGDTVLCIYAQNNYRVADVGGQPYWKKFTETDRANARLIAAAPDMLAALEAIVAQILDYERVNNLAPNPGRKYCWDATERAVAAITKAAAGD